MSLFTLIAFAFLCAALYYICPLRLRWILLLLVSYGYYAYCGLSALPYILTTTLSTWAGALLIGRVGEQSKAYLREHKAELPSYCWKTRLKVAMLPKPDCPAMDVIESSVRSRSCLQSVSRWRVRNSWNDMPKQS